MSAGELRPEGWGQPVGRSKKQVHKKRAAPCFARCPDRRSWGVDQGAQQPLGHNGIQGMRADQTAGCGTGGPLHCKNAQEAHFTMHANKLGRLALMTATRQPPIRQKRCGHGERMVSDIHENSTTTK